jgi:hypothetical protein
MTTIEEAVYFKMVSDADLFELVGTRVYPLFVPQDVPLPAIAYQKISSVKHQAHAESSHLAMSRFQFTIEADDYADAKDTAEALRNCWDSFAGFVGNTQGGLTIQGTTIENEMDGENIGASGQQTTPLIVVPVVRMDVSVWHFE